MNNRIGDRFRDAYRDTRRWWEQDRDRDDYDRDRARGYEYDEGRERRFGETSQGEHRFGSRQDDPGYRHGRERQPRYEMDRDRDRELEHRERMRYHDEPARFGMRQQGSSDWREDVDRDRWREGSQMGGRFAGGMGGGGGGGMMVGPDPTGRYWYRGPGQDMVDERYGSAMRDVGRFEGGHHGSQGRMREEHRRYPAGPKGYRRSDDRIRDDLCDTLHQAHDIDSSEVEVKVQSSEVILSGTVPERHMKLRIEQLADRIPGVTDVNNQIRVRRMASQIGPMGREQPIRPQSFGEESEGNGRRTGSPPRA